MECDDDDDGEEVDARVARATAPMKFAGEENDGVWCAVIRGLSPGVYRGM